MNKKLLLVVVAVLAVAVIGALVWSATRNVEQGERQSESAEQVTDQRRAEVLEEARRFEPDGMTACLTVLTPARHVETGVTYTFPTSCLPDGWEAIDRDQSDDAVNGERDGASSSPDDTTASPSATAPQNTGSRDMITPDDQHSRESARQQALREAENFRPKEACATVMTPARHIATGVTYTFPSSCLPDGWEPLPRDGSSPSARQ